MKKVYTIAITVAIETISHWLVSLFLLLIGKWGLSLVESS